MVTEPDWVSRILQQLDELKLAKEKFWEAAQNVASNLDDIVRNFSVDVNFKPLVKAIQERRDVGSAMYSSRPQYSSYVARNGDFEASLSYYPHGLSLTRGQPTVLVDVAVMDRVTGEKVVSAYLYPHLKDKAQIVLEDPMGKTKPLSHLTGFGYAILDAKDFVPGMYRIKLQPISQSLSS